MHKTLVENLKFNIDSFECYKSVYFLEGWIHSSGDDIDKVKIETSAHDSQELQGLLVRRDVNEFYSLPELSQTGFKFTLLPKVPFEFFIFSVKFKGGDKYQVFSIIDDLDKLSSSSPSMKTDDRPAVSIKNKFPGAVIVDDYYDDPDAVRKYALKQKYVHHSADHKGQRTNSQFIFDGTKEAFESILQRKITNWETYAYNGVFQYCVAEDPLVYHTDPQTYAAVIFLTPDAPPECGTSFFRSRNNGLMRAPTDDDCKETGKTREQLVKEMYSGNFYDKTRWDLVDVVGNVYNRLVFFDAKRVHAASEYFGDNAENSRLFQIFFFDTEEMNSSV